MEPEVDRKEEALNGALKALIGERRLDKEVPVMKWLKEPRQVS